jgi:ADP-ribose pyrophosphatase
MTDTPDDKPRMTWKSAEPQYREEKKGELRWIVNRETTENAATGDTHTRSTIRHPGVVVILPIQDDGRILLMRQYRYAADDVLWELPAGTREGREDGRFVTSDETPEECAARELEEEIGWRASRLEAIGEAYAMPGMSDELIHCFEARGLVKTKEDRDEGELILEIRPIAEDELRRMVATNEIRDAKTLAALLFHWTGASVG